MLGCGACQANDRVWPVKEIEKNTNRKIPREKRIDPVVREETDRLVSLPLRSLISFIFIRRSASASRAITSNDGTTGPVWLLATKSSWCRSPQRCTVHISFAPTTRAVFLDACFKRSVFFLFFFAGSTVTSVTKQTVCWPKGKTGRREADENCANVITLFTTEPSRQCNRHKARRW